MHELPPLAALSSKTICKPLKTTPNLATTLKIINNLDKGENVAQTANLCKTEPAIVREIKSKSDDIKTKMMAVGPENVKVVKLSLEPIINQMESILMEWITKNKNDVELEYSTIRSKALEIVEDLAKNNERKIGNVSVYLQSYNFNASRAWYERFLKCHNLQKKSRKECIMMREKNVKDVINQDPMFADDMSYRSHISPVSSSMESTSIGSPNSSSMSPYSVNENSPDPSRYVMADIPHNTEMSFLLNDNPQGEAHLVILEQPTDKFRFRYRSEMMGTHGSLMAKSSERMKKVYPTVELRNYSGPAIVSCSLYQVTEQNRSPHSHHLVLKNSQNSEEIRDPHNIEVHDGTGYIVAFPGMGIIHTAKKFIADELYNKMLKDFDRRKKPLRQSEKIELRNQCMQDAKYMNLNSVCLCFEAFNAITWEPICKPIYSTPINNMKSAMTGDLRICRLSRRFSSAMGGEEIFLFVEKVSKKNIKVKFYELDEDDCEVWNAFGSFSEFDVHHQYAIALKTPPYKDQNIQEDRKCYIQLLRPTDNSVSEPLDFLYKPSARILGSDRKRVRMDSNFNSDEFLSTLPTVLTSMNLSTPEFISNEYSSLTLCESDMKDAMNSDEFKNFLEMVHNDISNTRSLDSQGESESESSLTTDCMGRSKPTVSTSEVIIVHAQMADMVQLSNQNVYIEQQSSDKVEILGPNTQTVDKGKKIVKLRGGRPSPSNADIESKKFEDTSKKSGNEKPVLNRKDKSVESQREFFRSLNNLRGGWLPPNDDDSGSKTGKEGKFLDYLKLKKVNDNDNADIERSINMAKERSTKLQTFIDFEIKHQLIMLLKNVKDPTAANDSKTKRDNESAVTKLFMTGENGNTVLHGAVDLDEMSIARDMLDLLVHCNLSELLNVKNHFGKSILHAAIEKKHYTYIKPLLAAGINPNITDDDGNTPLHAAVREKCLNAVTHLLNSKSKHKVEIDVENNDGKTALHLAVAGGNCQIVAKLLAKNADVNHGDALNDNTALHIAVENNHPDVVKILLDVPNISVDEYNRQGHTPLHLACVINSGKGSEIIVHKLLEAQADPLMPMDSVKHEPKSDDEDSDQEDRLEIGNAFELATSNPQILELLKKYTKNREQSSESARVSANAEIFHDALDQEFAQIKIEHNDVCSFDEDTVIQLSKILDKSENWINVAEMLGFTTLMNFVDKESQSPTRILLGHIENTGHLSYQTLIDILQGLDELECANIIKSIVQRTNTNP